MPHQALDWGRCSSLRSRALPLVTSQGHIRLLKRANECYEVFAKIGPTSRTIPTPVLEDPSCRGCRGPVALTVPSRAYYCLGRPEGLVLRVCNVSFDFSEARAFKMCLWILRMSSYLIVLVHLFEHCEGFCPPGNLAAAKNPRSQIRTIRARNGQNSGRTSIKYGGPGGIRTRDLPDCWLAFLANRTFFGPSDGHTRLNYRPYSPIRGKSTFNLSETSPPGSSVERAKRHLSFAKIIAGQRPTFKQLIVRN